MNSREIMDLPAPKGAAREYYGSAPEQFAELFLPPRVRRHPIVLYIHGGFWKAVYDLKHAGHAANALAQAGAAVWNLEYRRISEPGGGWPGTFEDIVSAAKYLTRSAIALKYNLDATRIVVAGHSAGGHLSILLAAQNPIPLRAAISLGGVVDLQRAWELRLSNGIVETFLGATPAEKPEANPYARLPIKPPQVLIHGTQDDIVPFEISERFAAASHNATLIPLKGAGHFELIDPRTPEWKTVEQAILKPLH